MLPELEGYDNVSVLRTLDDAARAARRAAAGVRLAVVGAGFIGLEAASSAPRVGAEVTIVEALDAPLAGVLGRRLSATGSPSCTGPRARTWCSTRV